MSEETADSDKQFEPSQKKLDDARVRGEIAKSNDLTTAAAYGGLLLAMLTVGPAALIGLATTMRILLSQSDQLAQVLFAGSAMPVLGGVLNEVVRGVAPWFAIPMVLAILSVVAQRAFVVAPSKIAPKLNRISPLAGFKNKFGRQGLFEFLKSAAKLLVYCVILGVFLGAQIDRVVGVMHLPPALIMAELGRMVLGLMVIVLLVATVIGGIDFLWQRAEHLRKNRMSRKEMMDELKQSEGDPAMKQQRRQKGHDIAMNRMLVDVPTADVVIVNPTHYAVALKWDRTAGSAPVCVAKGVDEIAARIRELAQDHDVPLHNDPPTARALHASVAIGDEIAPDHYRAVAAAIRFAETMRDKARRS